MATLIKEDYHWVKEEKYKHLEYLHDALQRVILKFVLENKEASFMDLQKSTEHRQVEQVFIAPPQIYRRSPPPMFVPLASTRDKKRKATSPNMYGTQLLSAASHGDKSGHDNLMVCLIAWVVSSAKLCFIQAESGSVSVISERSGDIDGDKMVCLIVTASAFVYWLIIFSVSSRGVDWILPPSL